MLYNNAEHLTIKREVDIKEEPLEYSGQDTYENFKAIYLNQFYNGIEIEVRGLQKHCS